MIKVLKISAAAAIVSLGFSSCKVFQGAEVACSPDPIEVHADSITIKISADVPPKSGMRKGGTYVGEGKIGEVSQGKIVFSSDRYPNLRKMGIDTQLVFKRPYFERMDGNQLVIKQTYGRKGKTYELPDLENLCNCCITTSYNVYEGSYLIFSEHSYQKKVKVERNAKFNFPKNVFAIQEDQYSKSDITAIGEYLKKKYITDKVVIEGFASPEGPYARNVMLSVNRSKEVRMWLTEQLKAAGYNNYLDSTFFDIRVTNEDWEGFKNSIGDKYPPDVTNQIISLVSAGLEPDDLERQIMALVGGKDKVEYILAPLRRATIRMAGYEVRRTDEEIDKIASDFIRGNGADLKDTFGKEEWMYAISRRQKNSGKRALLEAFRDAYPSDPRPFNDLGVVALLSGDLDAGANYLDKAYKLRKNDYGVLNNVGVAYLKQGKYQDAKAILESSVSLNSNPEANFNLGVVLEKMARYNQAVEKFNVAGELYGASYNAGLSKLLMGDLNGAKNSFNESIRKNGDKMAEPYYGLAVVGARSKDASLMGSNLKKACTINSEYKDKARKDLEFRNYYTSAEFKTAIQ